MYIKQLQGILRNQNPFFYGIKSLANISINKKALERNSTSAWKTNGADETRTRDLPRDRRTF